MMLKDKILSVLQKYAKFEINLGSEQAREILAREILLILNDHEDNEDDMPRKGV
jgi:septum formation topological specificity factor MinE|tara:strand:+ start:1676 stop:1837 length:162 start_codon:yes stop_codon:yes gene_type:complete